MERGLGFGRFEGWASILMGVCVVAACGGDGEGTSSPAVDGRDGGTVRTERTCADFGWRMATPGEVVCPGVRDCSCGGGDVCCFEVDGDFQVTGASCDALEQCRGVALSCDGPEDCPDGSVCCMSGRGLSSECVPERDCFGVEEIVLCRTGSDCPFNTQACVPAADGAYLEDRAAYCE